MFKLTWLFIRTPSILWLRPESSASFINIFSFYFCISSNFCMGLLEFFFYLEDSLILMAFSKVSSMRLILTRESACSWFTLSSKISRQDFCAKDDLDLLSAWLCRRSFFSRLIWKRLRMTLLRVKSLTRLSSLRSFSVNLLHSTEVSYLLINIRSRSPYALS